MHNALEQRLRMLKAVQYTLTTNSDITSSFAREVSLYDEYIYRIREISNKHSNPPQDKSVKLSTEENVKKFCNKIASALRVYGGMVGRNDLLGDTSIKEKSIYEKSESDLYLNSQKIFNLAVENKNNLMLFGINDNVLNDFENLVYMFGKILGYKSSFELEDTKEVELEKICDSALNFLEKTVDILVEKKKSIFPKFYGEYKTARAVKSDETTQNSYFFA